MGETAFSLLARLSNRPPLLEGFFVLDNAGPRSKEVIEVSGSCCYSKSVFILDFIVQAVIPRKYGGSEAGVIFIDCDHTFSVIRLASYIESKIKEALNNDTSSNRISNDNEPDFNVNNFNDIKECLNRIHIFSCYESDHLFTVFHFLKRFLVESNDISLVIIDNIGAFYWQDRLFQPVNMLRMETHIDQLLLYFYQCLSNFYVSVLVSRPNYFSSTNYNCSRTLNYKCINTKLFISSDSEGKYKVEVTSPLRKVDKFFVIREDLLSWLS